MTIKEALIFGIVFGITSGTVSSLVKYFLNKKKKQDNDRKNK